MSIKAARAAWSPPSQRTRVVARRERDSRGRSGPGGVARTADGPSLPSSTQINVVGSERSGTDGAVRGGPGSGDLAGVRREEAHGRRCRQEGRGPARPGGAGYGELQRGA